MAESPPRQSSGKNFGIIKPSSLSRRAILRFLGLGSGTVALGQLFPAHLRFASQAANHLPNFTGPAANVFWNSIGPIVSYPQKVPLVLLTDRPVQLETPRNFFLTAFTPNDAFYVRWHLDEIPTQVNLEEWRLRIEGNVEHPLSLSLSDLLTRFKTATLAAVNQCSGNSRSRYQPRIPGGQWGNGAMGNAMWSGIKLSELLQAAGIKPGSVQVQFAALDRGKGPQGIGSHEFLKSLDLTDPVIEESLVAFTMNGEPLPMLNGFPVRLVVPGYFATYWVKSLSAIRILATRDENFWMKTAYRIPDTPRGNTSPDAVKAGKVKTIPIHRLPVRSFLISPDGASKIPSSIPVTLRGIAFSGYGRVVKVEISDDNAQNWRDAKLGENYGPYSFCTWEFHWIPPRPGRYQLAVRATDEKGNVQPDQGVWNPGGYLWNKIERQEIVVGAAK